MTIYLVWVQKLTRHCFNITLQKADKRAIDNLVSRTKFDQSIGGLDQSLQELLQRLEGQVRNTGKGTVIMHTLLFIRQCILIAIRNCPNPNTFN